MEERELPTLPSFLTDFCQYVSKAVGLPVVLGKRPFTAQYNEPFVAVWPTSFQNVGFDLSEYNDEIENRLIQKVRGLGILSLQVFSYGKGSFGLMKRLSLSVKTDEFSYFCESHSAAITERSEVSNESAPLLDSNYEERASISFSFYADLPEEFDVAYFDHIHYVITTKGVRFEGEARAKED